MRWDDLNFNMIQHMDGSKPEIMQTCPTTYIRMLFVDLCSAFSVISPVKLIEKRNPLGYGITLSN